METNYDVTRDAALKAAGDELLRSAMAYWQEYHRVTGSGAVVWLSDTDGRLVILTRFEYRWTLLENIETLRREMHFADESLEPRPYGDD